jgi:hypothetical protein
MAGHNTSLCLQGRLESGLRAREITASHRFNDTPEFIAMDLDLFSTGMQPFAANQIFDSFSRCGLGFENLVAIPSTQAFTDPDLKNNTTETQWGNDHQSYLNYRCSNKTK